MKELILSLLTLTLISCGYNLKTDREIANSQYQLQEAQDNLDKAKEQYEQLRDSLKIEALKLERFKDSIEFINLTRIMCYQSGPHRHSCEIYGNQLLTATKEGQRKEPQLASFEASEIASND